MADLDSGPWVYTITGEDGDGTPITPVTGDACGLVGTHTVGGLTVTDFQVTSSGRPRQGTFDCSALPTGEQVPWRRIKFATTIVKDVVGAHQFLLPLDYSVTVDPTNPDRVPRVLFEVGEEASDWTPVGTTPVPPSPPTVSGEVNLYLWDDTDDPAVSFTIEMHADAGTYFFGLDAPEILGYVLVGSDPLTIGPDPNFPEEHRIALRFFIPSPVPTGGVVSLIGHASNGDTLQFDVEFLSPVGQRLTATWPGGSNTMELTGGVEPYCATMFMRLSYFPEFDLSGVTFDFGAVGPSSSWSAPGAVTWVSGEYDIGPAQVGECLSLSQGPECQPCTGPPTNPWPPHPPPPPAVRRPSIYYNGAWREVVRAAQYRNGAFRYVFASAPDEPQHIYFNGAYHNVEIFDGETVPEPDTDEPPHHDPCHLMPPIIPPGELLPLAGRFFGMSNNPLGSLGNGSLFTGTQKALGNWYTQDLPFVASRQAVLVGGPGGGSRIKLNGRWDYAFFVSAWYDILAPLYDLLVYYTEQGWFFGQSLADDINSVSLWGPGGVNLVELAAAVTQLRAWFPGLRFGARARPSQFGFNPGFDFYFSQYTAERGNPATFAATEHGLCQARNAYHIVCLNFLHGGDGRSGVRYLNGTIKGQSDFNWMCSAEEVVEYFTAMYDAVADLDPAGTLLAGTLGYQYHADFLALPDMLAAMATVRNMLAAFPAP